MTLVIPQHYAHVIHSLRLTGDPEPMAVTYGVEVDPGVTDPDDVALACATAFDDVVNAMNAAYTMPQTEVYYQRDAPPADPVIGINTTISSGAGTGNVCPQNTALLFHKRGPVGGRGGRGRFYLPGVNETAVNNTGDVVAGDQSAWNTVMATFLAALNATSAIVGMRILHDSAGAYAAATPAPVSVIQIDPVVATQRRRLRR